MTARRTLPPQRLLVRACPDPCIESVLHCATPQVEVTQAISLPPPLHATTTTTFVCRVQVAQHPPLAPLTLVVKVFLRSCGLNEVANGGLSSFSITNMVLAHILQEMQVGEG